MTDYKHLEWDSSFFGFPIASVLYTNEIIIDQVLSTLLDLDYRLVYVHVPQKFKVLDNTLLSNYSGILVDRKITYRHVFSNIPDSKPCKGIRINTYSQVNTDLIELAITAGNFSRFKTDPNFGETHFRNLYTEWIKNSLSGKIADYVITYHTNDKPGGLVTLAIKDGTGKIGLISVADEIQNKGIGACLLNEVFALCYRQGAKSIEVVTQEDNHKACRFYAKNGFKKYNLEYIYHFWLKK